MLLTLEDYDKRYGTSFLRPTQPIQAETAMTWIDGYITSFISCYLLNNVHSQYLALINF